MRDNLSWCVQVAVGPIPHLLHTSRNFATTNEAAAAERQALGAIWFHTHGLVPAAPVNCTDESPHVGEQFETILVRCIKACSVAESIGEPTARVENKPTQLPTSSELLAPYGRAGARRRRVRLWRRCIFVRRPRTANDNQIPHVVAIITSSSAMAPYFTAVSVKETSTFMGYGSGSDSGKILAYGPSTGSIAHPGRAKAGAKYGANTFVYTLLVGTQGTPRGARAYAADGRAPRQAARQCLRALAQPCLRKASGPAAAKAQHAPRRFVRAHQVLRGRSKGVGWGSEING